MCRPPTVWMPSLCAGPPPWLGSLEKALRVVDPGVRTVVLSSAFMPSTVPWMLTRERTAVSTPSGRRSGSGRISVFDWVALPPSSR
jgi:hypothetical protein